MKVKWLTNYMNYKREDRRDAWAAEYGGNLEQYEAIKRGLVADGILYRFGALKTSKSYPYKVNIYKYYGIQGYPTLSPAEQQEYLNSVLNACLNSISE